MEGRPTRSRAGAAGQAALAALKPQARKSKAQTGAPSTATSTGNSKTKKRKQSTPGDEGGLDISPEELAKFTAWQKLMNKQVDKDKQSAIDAGMYSISIATEDNDVFSTAIAAKAEALARAEAEEGSDGGGDVDGPPPPYKKARTAFLDPSEDLLLQGIQMFPTHDDGDDDEETQQQNEEEEQGEEYTGDCEDGEKDGSMDENPFSEATRKGNGVCDFYSLYSLLIAFIDTIQHPHFLEHSGILQTIAFSCSLHLFLAFRFRGHTWNWQQSHKARVSTTHSGAC